MVQIEYNVEGGSSGARQWGQRPDPPAQLPTETALRAAQRALWGDARRRGYLTRTRGLTRATIRRYELGYSGGWVMPVRGEGGGLLTVVKHCPCLRAVMAGMTCQTAAERHCIHPSRPPGRSCSWPACSTRS